MSLRVYIGQGVSFAGIDRARFQDEITYLKMASDAFDDASKPYNKLDVIQQFCRTGLIEKISSSSTSPINSCDRAKISSER